MTGKRSAAASPASGPRKLAEAVLLRAEEILRNEKQIFTWAAEGETVQSITEKGGYF